MLYVAVLQAAWSNFQWRAWNDGKSVQLLVFQSHVCSKQRTVLAWRRFAANESDAQVCYLDPWSWEISSTQHSIEYEWRPLHRRQLALNTAFMHTLHTLFLKSVILQPTDAVTVCRCNNWRRYFSIHFSFFWHHHHHGTNWWIFVKLKLFDLLIKCK